jgi:DNA-binding transcriptional regulator LsrR (DeoR family)
VARDPEGRKALAIIALAMYTDGQTLVQIAEKLEVSYGKVHALIKEAGGEMRRRGGPARKKEQS